MFDTGYYFEEERKMSLVTRIYMHICMMNNSDPIFLNKLILVNFAIVATYPHPTHKTIIKL